MNKDEGPTGTFDGHFRYDDQKRQHDHLKYNTSKNTQYIFIS